MAANKENLRQEQQQRLQQRLNPQNVVLGRLLEMSAPEFEDEVRRELDDNPALEAIETADTLPDDNSFGETAEELQLADYGRDDIPSYRLEARNFSPDDRVVDAASITADDSDSAFDILTSRLTREGNLSPEQTTIGRYIIGNLDSNGYLQRSLSAICDDIAIAEGFVASPGQMREAFEAVRALDPAGIGAVDLRDCLLLQLDRMEPSPTVEDARTIVADYFDLFSKMHYDRLQAQTHIPRERMAEAIDLIRTLNPKPASSLESATTADRARHISPDFILDYDHGTDTFTVSLADRTPELAIEQTFSAGSDDEATNDRRRADALAFIRRKRDEANTFIRMTRARSETLLAIVRAIVEIQRDFFISGDKTDIRPMILKDIEARTGLDLSVISRATASKYILTPHGIYPIKLLFNERPSADSDASSLQILEALRNIIDREDKRSPMSDEALTSALEEAGFKLARRTVTKYRERLGLPVARLRKHF